MATRKKYIYGSLDYFVGSGHRRPEIWENNRPVTKKVFRILKAKKSPLLEYFQINYSYNKHRGIIEEVNAIIPPAFEGTILDRIRDTINEDSY